MHIYTALYTLLFSVTIKESITLCPKGEKATYLQSGSVDEEETVSGGISTSPTNCSTGTTSPTGAVWVVGVTDIHVITLVGISEIKTSAILTHQSKIHVQLLSLTTTSIYDIKSLRGVHDTDTSKINEMQYQITTRQEIFITLNTEHTLK